MNFLLNFAIGILIGFGAITPGISSGVFCVIFGIYEKLVNSIVNFFKDVKSNTLFLFPILLGAFVGIVLFCNAIKYFFTFYKIQSCFVFIGLILGTVPALFKQAFPNRYISVKKIIPMLIAFLIGILLIYFENTLNFNFIISSISSNIFYLVFAGFIMSIGIVVPGISNTVLLMCLGVYSTYISAIASVNLYILLPIAVGVFIGSIIWLKLISYLFAKHHDSTFSVIIGFTLGSVFVLFPGFTLNFVGIISAILCILATIISYKLSLKK